MTREDIEQWTREAGGFDATPEFLKHFAELVASAEREACAKVCEGYAPVMPKSSAQFFADVIRARGKA